MKTKQILEIPIDADISVEVETPKVDSAEDKLVLSIGSAAKNFERDFAALCANFDKKFKAKHWIRLHCEVYAGDVYYSNEVVALIPDLSRRPFTNPETYQRGDCPFNTSMGLSKLDFAGFKGVLPSENETRKIFLQNGMPFQDGSGLVHIGQKQDVATGVVCQKPNDNKFYALHLGRGPYKSQTILFSKGKSYYYAIVPIYRLSSRDAAPVSTTQAIFLWLNNDLTPVDEEFQMADGKKIFQFMKANRQYLKVEGENVTLNIKKIFDAVKNGVKFDFLQNVELPPPSPEKKSAPQSSNEEQAVIAELLECDYRRVALDKYDAKLLTDPNRGHWDLWDLPDDAEKTLKLKTPIYARNPAADINASGIVGIDFGTKSTVVVYENERGEIIPLQVGKGDYSKGNVKENYENPTIIEFRHIKKFLEDYAERDGRPQTSWNDVTVSHNAQSNLLSDQLTDTALFNSFFTEIKQWCGNLEYTAKLRDHNGLEIDLKAFNDINVEDGQFNPLEYYAYYLGSYINHMLQPNHIFMRYILSFPVTYEKDIRAKMLASFAAGIKKSLPTALLSNEEAMKKFRVVEGTSEPAAYAVTALENFGFIDGDEVEKIYYAVFDCGGGTTDFDFGVLRETGDDDSDAYDYILTHFGAAGDKTLGGEHLLQLLAFEIFKANIEKLLKPKENSAEKIPFYWATEKKNFPGSEGIVRDSVPAKLNMYEMVRAIRPLWEKPDSADAKKILNSGEVELKHIFYDTGKESTSFKLSIGVQNFSFVEKENYTAEKVDESKKAVKNKKVEPPKVDAPKKISAPLVDVEKILSDRIKRGVDNFFIALREAFDKVSGGSKNGVDALSDVKEIKIFLAGNSTKSALVKKIFEEYINNEDGKARELLGFGKQQNMPHFTLYPPLGTDEAKIIQLENGVEVDENNFAAPTCKTGVAFGLLRCRTGQEIKVVDITPEGKDQEQVPFQYYVGRRSKKKFKVIIDKASKLGQWYRFISAEVDSFDLLYTSESIVATNNAPASIARRLTINIDANPTASVYVKALSSNTICYAVSEDVPPPEFEGTTINLE